MRILKYLFLLILLATFAATVYVATLKADFETQTTIILKSPRATLFNYVNDYRNWETFVSWKKNNPETNFIYPKNTVGIHGTCSWAGDNQKGNLITTAVKNSEFIQQKINYNGAEANAKMTFKDTVGGTKITWKLKGKMSFGYKIYGLLRGGPIFNIEQMQQQSLVNLDKTIGYEINTYNIKVTGLVKKTGTFYIKQTINSEISKIPYNLRILIPRMVNFFSKNKIKMTGSPFVIYHSYDTVHGVSKLSVCMPIEKEIFISEGSDMSTGLLYPFQAVKATLTGDYSHTREAWGKARAYLNQKKYSENIGGTQIEIYQKNMMQVANPSKWITDVYVPVNSPIQPVHSNKPVLTNQPTPTQPTESSESENP
ncbi:GyrI-like domain-containing protein [Flavobacterium sp. CYK-55]|uniref:GyrI-like domain-containing protein n=1 Tax=Flavobacterium sp. CYK-55 TaxID=2835529 RepID=UPI001BCC7320|nr:GyrI-like domain-containing protein [Flavobacterium sp. CYK-55]MBS7788068.1 GyrI-like domain-containing protein [Flavobacterium sp. CYK-55]